MSNLRTAAGPDGTGGDVPDGPQPLGGPIVIAIPPDLLGQCIAIRWNCEQVKRDLENYLWTDAEVRLGELVKAHGLLYIFERHMKTLTALVTGVAGKTNTTGDSDGGT